MQVSPELVQVSTAAARWQAPFEAPITDVFQVQGQIAGRVAGALGVALRAGERERSQRAAHAEPGRVRRLLARRGCPANYVQGVQGAGPGEPPPCYRIVQRGRSARLRLRLGSGASGVCPATIYPWSVPTPATARAVERALARAQSLEAGAPPTQMALSVYWQNVRREPVKALAAAEQDSRERRTTPTSSCKRPSRTSSSDKMMLVSSARPCAGT